MELTRKQQKQVASKAADLSAEAAYAKRMEPIHAAELKARNRRYLDLRLSGLSIDDAWEALRLELGLDTIVDLVAYDDEYAMDATLEQVIEWHG